MRKLRPRGSSTCPRSHSREWNPGLNSKPNSSPSGDTASYSGSPQSSQQDSLQPHTPPTRAQLTRNLSLPLSGVPHLGRGPEAPTPPRGSPHFRPEAPPLAELSARPQPSPRAPGHGPALPPPAPMGTAVGNGPGTARRPRGRLSGPRPTRPSPGRRLVPTSRLTGSRRDRVRCLRPASVPSSSRSNRPTPPARPRDDLTRTPPLRADV